MSRALDPRQTSDGSKPREGRVCWPVISGSFGGVPLDAEEGGRDTEVARPDCEKYAPK